MSVKNSATTFIQDFKAFAMKGNVIDLAVAVVIGGAFGKIVNSFVADVIMPLMGVLTSGVDFKDLSWVVKPGVDGGAPVLLKYGSFIQSIIDFLIIAFFIFLAIRMIGKLNFRKQEEAAEEKAAAPKPDDVVLLEEIRDLLKERK